MSYIVKGNPFTHHQESRASMPGRFHAGGCDWCGQTPRTLFIYNPYAEPIIDEYGARYPYSSASLRAFCNKDCARAFFG